MQATGIDILDKIVARRGERLAAARAVEHCPEPEGDADLRSAENNAFLGGLAAKRGRAVIAEVKMGSPKLGSLVGRFDPEEQARTYAAHGAAALSVVVEPDFFHGSYELLAACQKASGLPAIAKDFVVDPLQIHWAREAGASAMLLIAALYTAEDLRRYAALARQYGLVPLIETHTDEDVAKLSGDPWELVGVNNRDLRTFKVDLEHSLHLVPRLPAEAIKVAESGIDTGADVAHLCRGGFDAFLIGEALVTSGDPAAKLQEFCA